MSEAEGPARAGRSLHDLRGSLNGVGLQLEVMALALARGDEAMHARALEAARRALHEAAAQLEGCQELR